MKKLSLLFILSLTIIMTACGNKITLSNVDTFENNYKYSKVSMGKIVEAKRDAIMEDAEEFVSKYLSVIYNRSYKNNTGMEQETILYDKEYFDANKGEIEGNIQFIKDFYQKYALTTELVNIDYKNIVNVNGDAYVTCVARVRLTECNNVSVAKILGFKDGINSNASCKYKLKLKYAEKGYTITHYEIVKDPGYMLPFKEYEEIIENTMTEEEKLSHFAYLVSKAQNDRIYSKFKGNEDYKYLSKACIEEINKERDNAKHIKELYTSYKLSTELVDCQVVESEKTEEGYKMRVRLRVKMLECINDEVAKQIGFKDGIGSIRTMNYSYEIITEDGELKLDSSEFLD